MFVEQPFPKDAPLDDFAWLTERSPIPIMADEMCQRLSDVRRVYGAVSGINIKLMKSTGMREAHKMLVLARSLGMKVMLGCMTETSCGISAASHLSPMVDWADLDGALLISNDVFDGHDRRRRQGHADVQARHRRHAEGGVAGAGRRLATRGLRRALSTCGRLPRFPCAG